MTMQDNSKNYLHQKTIAALFVRLTDLYAHKWTIKIKDDEGNPTRQFLLWADKLENRTPDEIAEGFRLLERKVQKDFEDGKESWPPSYAEFAALCKPYQYRQKPELPAPEISEEDRQKNIERFSAEMSELFKNVRVPKGLNDE